MKIKLIFLLVAVSSTCFGAATTQPVQKLSAKVLKVVGKAQYSLIGKDVWTNIKVGDVLGSESVIRTGIRSSVLMQLETNAVIQVKSATRIALLELARSESQEKTRINLDYGTIRGGIIKTKYESDFQISCPAAVLTREGTWGFEMNYDPATGDFMIRLDTEGLVRVLQLVSGKEMVISPDQYVTQEMMRWVETATMDRAVTLTDPFGVTKIERIFYANNSGGRTAANPTGQDGFQSNIRQGIQITGNTNLQRQEVLNQVLGVATVSSIINQLQQGQNTYEYQFGNFGTHIPQDVSGKSIKR